jgi:hypothetical protein
MNIGTLRERLVFYIDKEQLGPDLSSSAVDVILQAINNARLQAEQLHAFEMNKCVIEFPAVTTTTDWTTSVLRGTNTNVSVRNIKKLWRTSETAGLLEIPFVYRNLAQLKSELNFEDTLKATFVGNTLHLIGPGSEEPVNLVADAYRWMDDYTLSTDTDWMVKRGHNYLFWASMYELNYYAKEFVPRQEGNLSISDDYVQGQLGKLIALDNHIKNAYFNIL